MFVSQLKSMAGWVSTARCVRTGPLAHLVHNLDQSADIAETKGERLLAAGIVGNLRDVVGHQHAGIPNLFVNLNGFHEVDITLIRVYFDEIVAMAANIAEVHIEYLLPQTEVTYHVKNLLAWGLEHLGYRALAEVESVIGTLLDRDEL